MRSLITAIVAILLLSTLINARTQSTAPDQQSPQPPTAQTSQQPTTPAVRPTTPQKPEQAKEPQEPKEEAQVDMIWGLKIPMREGVRLNGTVFKPAGQSQPVPVIFTLTPYISDTYQPRAMYFARHGYVFVLVDVRGRGNSDGTFDPFAQEAHDGYDVVEFLAKQPWSNGKITMWGGSYAGFDQWATLKEAPPHLATVVPVASAHAGVDFPFFHGIFSSYDMQWLTFTSGKTPNENLFGDSSFWIAKFQQLYRNMEPYDTLDKVVGNTTTVFQKWLQHPYYDAYWQAMAPTPEQYQKMNVPILTITGDYDGDQPGAMSYYREHMQYGNPEARSRHYLIIGPWDHPGTRTPKKEVGGLTFGDASVLDMNKLHKEWYDWTLKNGPKPEFLKQHVAYYVVGKGAENWKYAESLDAIATENRTLYLSSQNGVAGDVFHSGQLSAKAQSSQPDHFTYDPRDLRPGDLEKEEVKAPLTDERFELNLFGNGVVYHTEPFEEATEISGYVKLRVWMSMDVSDTDFSVSLYEILPQGGSVQLTSDMLRARYRESIREPKLVQPGAVVPYDFTGFTWFSRRVQKGSRLRLVLNCPNSSFQEKNYNSGGRVEAESGKDARVAHITVYHDTEHPSSLEIPIVK